jgi:hypothetical protein
MPGWIRASGISKSDRNTDKEGRRGVQTVQIVQTVQTVYVIKA